MITLHLANACLKGSSAPCCIISGYLLTCKVKSVDPVTFHENKLFFLKRIKEFSFPLFPPLVGESVGFELLRQGIYIYIAQARLKGNM